MDGFIAVRALQKDDAQCSRALFVFIVEKQILIETKESCLPFAAVQRSTLQIAARVHLFGRLFAECQKLNIVHTNGRLLHTETSCRSPVPTADDLAIMTPFEFVKLLNEQRTH